MLLVYQVSICDTILFVMTKKKTKKASILSPEDGYNLYAPSYDRSTGYLDSFEEGAQELLYGGIDGLKILDAGCGTGRTVRNLLHWGAEVTATDLSEEMVKIIKMKFSKVEAIQSDIEELPFEDDTFDAAYSMLVIVHLKDLDRAFDEIYRVLKPGGYFILSNINQRKPPVLTTKKSEEIIIESYYHMPQHVIDALEASFFKIERDELVYEGKTWINQIIKARKR